MTWENRLPEILAAFLVLLPNSLTLVIQAEIDLDDDSEYLIGNLINKVDAIIDPHTEDTINATKELAYALLKIGPLLTIKGNVSDRLNKFSFSFSLDAKAGETNAISTFQDNPKEDDYVESFFCTLENYTIAILNIIGHAIMTNVVANLMHDLALHSDTNLIC